MPNAEDVGHSYGAPFPYMVVPTFTGSASPALWTLSVPSIRVFIDVGQPHVGPVSGGVQTSLSGFVGITRHAIWCNQTAGRVNGGIVEYLIDDMHDPVREEEVRADNVRRDSIESDSEISRALRDVKMVRLPA